MADDAQDVLVRTRRHRLRHKHPKRLRDDEEPYWRIANGTPRQTEPGRRIWFATDNPQGPELIAVGTITGLSDGRIWFDAAHTCHLPCLDDAPTRGFTYVEPIAGRLADIDWSEHRLSADDAEFPDFIEKPQP